MARHQSLTRTIRREILFTKEEWEQVSMRYTTEKNKGESLNSWVRRSLLEPLTVTIEINADTDMIHEQVKGVSSNVNQIAHLANINKTVQENTLNDVFDELHQINELIQKLEQENRILIEKQLTQAYERKRE